MSQASDLQNLYTQAVNAYQQGRPTFVARLRSGAWGSPTGQLGGWMDSVDAVESAGWVLEHWTAFAEPSGAFNAFPLFRRREPYLPPQSSSSSPTPQDRV